VLLSHAFLIWNRMSRDAPWTDSDLLLKTFMRWGTQWVAASVVHNSGKLVNSKAKDFIMSSTMVESQFKLFPKVPANVKQ
jgi:hypothetical protein